MEFWEEAEKGVYAALCFKWKRWVSAFSALHSGCINLHSHQQEFVRFFFFLNLHVFRSPRWLIIQIIAFCSTDGWVMASSCRLQCPDFCGPASSIYSSLSFFFCELPVLFLCPFSRLLVFSSLIFRSHLPFLAIYPFPLRILWILSSNLFRMS